MKKMKKTFDLQKAGTLPVLVRLCAGDALTAIFDYLTAVAANNPNNIIVKVVDEAARPLDFRGRWEKLVKEFGLSGKAAEIPALAEIASQYENSNNARRAIDRISADMDETYIRVKFLSMFVFYKQGRRGMVPKQDPEDVLRINSQL